MVITSENFINLIHDGPLEQGSNGPGFVASFKKANQGVLSDTVLDLLTYYRQCHWEGRGRLISEKLGNHSINQDILDGLIAYTAINEQIKKSNQRSLLLKKQGLPLSLMKKSDTALFKMKQDTEHSLAELDDQLNLLLRTEDASHIFTHVLFDVGCYGGFYGINQNQLLLSDGNYVVGQDELEAGWYTLMAYGSHYVSNNLDYDEDQIVIKVIGHGGQSNPCYDFSINLKTSINDRFKRVRLFDGEKLEIKPSALKGDYSFVYLRKLPDAGLSAFKTVPFKMKILPGFYEVGHDLRPGKYSLHFPKIPVHVEGSGFVVDSQGVPQFSFSVYDKEGTLKWATTDRIANPRFRTFDIPLHKGDVVVTGTPIIITAVSRHLTSLMIQPEI